MRGIFKVFWISRHPAYALTGCGIGLEAGLLSLISLGNLTQQAGWYVAITTGLFGLFGLAAWLTLQRDSQTQQKEGLLVILFFAALFRLTTLFIAPTLSTDQFRYTWEGRLVSHGLSPYRYAPADPALTAYHTGIWHLVQQKETASPYPPLAQLIGAAEYLLLGENLLGPKLAAIFFDLLSCLALLWLLKMYGLDQRRLILYAWCPLPILEFGISGHNDAPMLCLLLLAIGLAEQRKPAQSALVLGLAGLAKFTPLLALPLFLASWLRPTKNRLTEASLRQAPMTEQAPTDNRLAAPVRVILRVLTRATSLRQAPTIFLRFGFWGYPLLTGLVIVLGYGPFLIAGQGAIGSILEYTGSWRDNEGLIYQTLLDWPGPALTKVLSVGVLAGVVLTLSFRPSLVERWSLPRRLLVLFGTMLLVASTVHAWYVTWLLVLLPLAYNRDSVFKGWDRGWLLFAALVSFPYLSYMGDLSIYNWVKPLEYWPLYLFILWDLFRAVRLQNIPFFLKRLRRKPS